MIRPAVMDTETKPPVLPASDPTPGETPAEEGNRRGDIVRAAGRLFREKGYAATTIREIADAVNMRSGSPFYYFKTKNDMLRAVVMEGIGVIHRAVSEAIRQAAEQQLSPEATLELMIRTHLEQLLTEDGRDFAAVMLHETGQLDADTLAEVGLLKDRYETLWQDMLAVLKEAGLIGSDSRIRRLFIMGAMNWATLWYKPEGDLKPAELARELTDFLLGRP